MPPDPSIVMLAVMSVIGGTMVFAVLLLFGSWLVRWLRLPQDPPEVLRFEPPPPPLQATGDATVARVTAERQGRLRAAFVRGLESQRSAMRCHELQLALERAVAAAPAGADGEPLRLAAATGVRAAATARSAATAAEQLVREADRRLRTEAGGFDDASIVALDRALAAQSVTATGALTEAEGAARLLTDVDGRRRIWVMLLVLGALLAWVVAMQFLLRR